MLLLKTPHEIAYEVLDLIEEERKRQNKRQADLAKDCGITRKSYTNYLSKKNMPLQVFIKILLVLGLTDKLETLTEKREVTSIEEIKLRNKMNQLPKRVRTKDAR